MMNSRAEMPMLREGEIPTEVLQANLLVAFASIAILMGALKIAHILRRRKGPPVDRPKSEKSKDKHNSKRKSRRKQSR
jgi:hypothetical protein